MLQKHLKNRNCSKTSNLSTAFASVSRSLLGGGSETGSTVAETLLEEKEEVETNAGIGLADDGVLV